MASGMAKSDHFLSAVEEHFCLLLQVLTAAHGDGRSSAVRSDTRVAWCPFGCEQAWPGGSGARLVSEGPQVRLPASAHLYLSLQKM